MFISEGARLKGGRFSNSLYAYAIFDEGYKFNVLVEEATELAWLAFITQHSVMEPVVVVFVLVCILFCSIYPNICFVHSISIIHHACIFVKHLILISSF
ncbi:unnamed protein product [Triticum turgidum subsp. durum]|uniref:Uncharacterized protein n=1 Tax=Triticum turgidum subsp. durum TaxID=4567 RepID=A0A9R1QVF0_TRITD|nr:unnamed protein product [Triticum turgidum subsp. durum]